MPGPYFYDESVQKVLASGPYLNQYTKYVKYPRTRHHPLSESITEYDKVNHDLSSFIGQDIVITIKMEYNRWNYNNRKKRRQLKKKCL